MPEEIARKLFYKLNEVCQITDTQPYVLRFWESEFAQLAPTRSRTGQRLYRRKDIDLVLSIKKLIQDEGLTISGVRDRLGMNGGEQSIEGLYEPAPPPPPEPSRAIPALSRELGEILKLMDETDRRLSAPPRRGRG
ncbi:MAG TPA: MerR family transcriptional regulator [Candidatus Polarisedimenticolia bacterium]|nr:MerR family transcriptional regulator [Candidatus Polarisedimenticolia bacterium]